MTVKHEVEFNKFVCDIIKNNEFIELKNEIHHGISRLDHCLSVARLTYKIGKIFRFKKNEEMTRAALLHDFFKNDQLEDNRFINHPLMALNNAKRNFEITELEANVIASHMFPTAKIMPKYKESWIVSLADKIVAIKECTRYKVPLTIGATFIFFINFCIIQR